MDKNLHDYQQYDSSKDTNPSHTGPRLNLPPGIILIIFLATISSISSLTTVINPKIIIGVFVITGLPAMLYGLSHMGVHIVLIIWLARKKEKGRKLGLIISIYYSIFYLAISCFAILNRHHFLLDEKRYPFQKRRSVEVLQ